MIQNSLTNGLNRVIGIAGRPIKLIYYNETIGSVWDDEVSLSESGTAFISGLVFPMDSRKGSVDSVLLEQGRLIDGDKRLYVNGSVLITGSETQLRIQLGSNVGESYAPIPLGGIAPEVQGIQIYKKVYIRRLTNGSLIGE